MAELIHEVAHEMCTHHPKHLVSRDKSALLTGLITTKAETDKPKYSSQTCLMQNFIILASLCS